MSRTPKITRVARRIRDEYSIPLTAAKSIAQALHTAGQIDDPPTAGVAAAAEAAREAGGRITVEQASAALLAGSLVVDFNGGASFLGTEELQSHLHEPIDEAQSFFTETLSGGIYGKLSEIGRLGRAHDYARHERLMFWEQLLLPATDGSGDGPHGAMTGRGGSGKPYPVHTLVLHAHLMDAAAILVYTGHPEHRSATVGQLPGVTVTRRLPDGFGGGLRPIAEFLSGRETAGDGQPSLIVIDDSAYTRKLDVAVRGLSDRLAAAGVRVAADSARDGRLRLIPDRAGFRSGGPDLFPHELSQGFGGGGKPVELGLAQTLILTHSAASEIFTGPVHLFDTALYPAADLDFAQTLDEEFTRRLAIADSEDGPGADFTPLFAVVTAECARPLVSAVTDVAADVATQGRRLNIHLLIASQCAGDVGAGTGAGDVQDHLGHRLALRPAAERIAYRWASSPGVDPHLLLGSLEEGGAAAASLADGGVLLTGITGQGKSYTLRRALLRMCAVHGPGQVQLIAGSGGLGATPWMLAELPHTVGTYTEVARDAGPLVAHIRSEMDARSEMTVEELAAVPWLVVVVDDFPSLDEMPGQLRQVLHRAERMQASSKIRLVLTLHRAPRRRTSTKSPINMALYRSPGDAGSELVRNLPTRVHFGPVHESDADFHPAQVHTGGGYDRALVRWRRPAGDRHGELTAMRRIVLPSLTDTAAEELVRDIRDAVDAAVTGPILPLTPYQAPPLPALSEGYPGVVTAEALVGGVLARVVVGVSDQPETVPDTVPPLSSPAGVPVEELRGAGEVVWAQSRGEEGPGALRVLITPQGLDTRRLAGAAAADAGPAGLYGELVRQLGELDD